MNKTTGISIIVVILAVVVIVLAMRKPDVVVEPAVITTEVPAGTTVTTPETIDPATITPVTQ